MFRRKKWVLQEARASMEAVHYARGKISNTALARVQCFSAWFVTARDAVIRVTIEVGAYVCTNLGAPYLREGRTETPKDG